MKYLNSKVTATLALLTVTILFLTGCDCSNQLPTESFVTTPPSPLQIAQSDFEIAGDLKSFKPKWSSKKMSEGITLYTLTLTSGTPAEPPKFTLKWHTPSIDIHGFWTPNISLDKSTYYRAKMQTRAVRYAPVISLYSNNETNRFTFAVSDTLNNLDVGAWLKEEDICFHYYIEFFKEKHPALKEYSVTIRVDNRALHYSEVLRSVSQWWAGLTGHKPAPVPEGAKQPMYSTWYSFHQNITAHEVVEQCNMSKKLGFEAVIVDDGWQTLDSKRGYAFTGDWEPERIKDMKGFVEQVHQTGMKFLLWYSVPFIGEKAKNYAEFKGKYLYYWEGQGAYVLDPRYPEVREFIINTYIKAMKDWKLDGFKLDFMGMFRPGKDTPLTARDGRDFASIDQAVDRLMTGIMGRLRDIKADIMIEFRQPYIGPLMRKYGNMFRAADCPNMALVNRVRTTDIRLLCGNTAVHSDMFRWHDNEPVEAAALQVLNILYSVPQLSVKIDRLSGDHKEMIKFWTNYWKKNRAVLLEGKFKPFGVQENYPLIKGYTKDKAIYTLYRDRFIHIGGSLPPEVDIVNAKQSQQVILDLKSDQGAVTVKTLDCKGIEKSQNAFKLKAGPHRFNVPPSGLLTIKKQNRPT